MISCCMWRVCVANDTLHRPIYMPQEVYLVSRSSSREGIPPRIQPFTATPSTRFAGFVIVDAIEGMRGYIS